MNRSNEIVLISPYIHNGLWVFDDPERGLLREPFVAGADRVIDVLTRDFPDAHKGFNLLFSGTPFPGHNATLRWERAESGGNVYLCEEAGLAGWLCPALLRYFDRAPETIYAQFKPMSRRTPAAA